MKATGFQVCVGLILAVFVLQAGVCRAAMLGTSAAHSSASPLLVYYSLTGSTRTIAQELAANRLLETEALVSKKNRHNIFKITCVFDQLFDRDDDLQPLTKDVCAYRHLIIASPVWIHRLASPVRTFLKTSKLRGKTAWLVLTHNGNFDAEDQDNIIRFVESFGIRVQGCIPVCTKDRSLDQLRQAARVVAGEIKFPGRVRAGALSLSEK